MKKLITSLQQRRTTPGVAVRRKTSGVSFGSPEVNGKTVTKFVALLLCFTQFLMFASPTLAAVTNYSYDSNGNMESDGTTCYEYNDANRLSKVKDCATGQLQAEYLYDDTGDRGIKKVYNNGQLVNTVYSRSQFFETKINAQGEEENTSYYHIDGRLIAKKNPDGSVNYIHRDHLGSSTVVTDDSGNLVEESEYYPYGQLKSGGYEVKYGYTGQEKDWEGNQLNYYGARYYDAQLGRFTQPDSMLPDPYDPQQINRYAYVRNNPIIYVDPNGHSIKDLWGKVVDGVTGFVENTKDWFNDTTNDISESTNSSINSFGLLIGTVVKQGETILPYKEMQTALKGTLLEGHHVIEKRFSDVLKLNSKDMLSTPLSPNIHKTITQQWRSLIPYSNSNQELNTSNVTYTNVKEASDQISKMYPQYPNMNKAMKDTLMSSPAAPVAVSPSLWSILINMPILLLPTNINYNYSPMQIENSVKL